MEYNACQNTTTASGLTAGIYVATVTDSKGCTAQSTTNLNDPGANTVTLTSSDADNSICQNECITLTANSATAVSYEFFVGAISVQGPGAVTTYTTCALNNGDILTVECKDGIGCTFLSNQITMNVNALPTAFTVSKDSVFCAGTPGAPVILNGSENGVTYTLYMDGAPTAQTLTGNGATISYGNQNVPGTHIYTVYAENNTTLCAQMMNGSATLTVNPLPTAYNVSVSGTGHYCSGGTGLNICLDGSENGFTYQAFIDGIAGPTVVGTGAAICFNNQTTAGTYTVIATNPLTGCQSNMTGFAKIDIDPLPVAYGVTVTGTGSYCSGGAGLPICVGNSEANVNYQLLLGGVNTGVQIPGTGSAICFPNQTTAGTYTVNGVNSLTGCSNLMNGSATISIWALPTANAGADTTICQWSSAALHASDAGAGAIYAWTPAMDLTDDSISNPVATPAANATYTLTVMDANGCTNSDDIAVNSITIHIINCYSI